jgi:hypothetical protein
MPWNSAFDDPSSYRRRVRADAPARRVVVGETDLWITADSVPIDAAAALAARIREEISLLGTRFPPFLASLAPVDVPPGIRVAPAAEAMLLSARTAGVGPMAAVPGTIAEEVCRELARSGRDVIVENGGDVYIVSAAARIVAIYAGKSPFSMRLGIRLAAAQLPCAVCTSSGRIGPSLSFGRADAAVVVSRSGALADAAATALGNRIQGAGDVAAAAQWAAALPGVIGAVAVAGDAMAVQGALELVELEA